MNNAADAYGLNSRYLSRKRLASYAHQLSTVLELRPATVLEVGKGPGLVSGALRAVGVKVVTLDLRPQLEPDLVGSVVDIPAQPGQFDVVICCQVLEHLPFEEFGRACRELRRVARRATVMSLPDITSHYFLHARLPVLKHLSFAFSLPRLNPPKKKTGPDVAHWWEIGFRGTPLSRVQSELRASGWDIERTWRVPEQVWHRFFLLRARAESAAPPATVEAPAVASEAV